MIKKYKKQFIAILFFLCILSFLAIVSRQHLVPAPFIAQPVMQQPIVAHIRDNKPTIVSSYLIHESQPDYQHVAYRPRQFVTGTNIDIYPDFQTNVTNPGIYKGWDVLNTPRSNKNLTNWFTVYLNRQATIGIVWRGEKTPPWLSSWKLSDTVALGENTYPVYKKVITTSFTLPATTNTDPLYTILFAENNGKPSIPPTSPLGRVIPQANQTCPAWVHNEFQARGPDGKLYPTWHPLIDPIYWCYFNHEHGVNPDFFDKNFKIAFGYAGNAMGMHEAHPGYKVYAWDDQYGYRWLALQHQGTATNQAACGQYHELDIATKNKASGEIVSEQYFVGDFGSAKTLNGIDPFKPSACPNQAKKQSGEGVKFLPIATIPTILEEPWTVNSKGVIGFNFASFTVETLDSMRMCADMTCDTIVYTGDSGSNHTISYVLGFGPKAGNGYNGIYYTDPMGHMLMSQHTQQAIRQYIKPGVSISSNIPYISTSEASCRDIDGTESLMQCGIGLTSISNDRENSIKLPN